MTFTTIRPLRLAAALAACAVLLGCAAPPKPIYQWGSYQGQVYQHFKGQETGPEAQIALLEADLQKIKASGSTPPPGYHAHLGMLYASLGKDTQALQQLQAEKGLFPESATYIDFLLAKAKK